jgi:uncharacterized protein (TIGR02145 family)
MKKISYLILAAVIAVAASCKKDPKNEPAPIPAPDLVTIGGKSYKTIHLGGQLWTSENYSGNGGVAYPAGKAHYGKYYSRAETEVLVLPEGWRIPTMNDYIRLAQSQGITFQNNVASNQAKIANLTSASGWLRVQGTNASGFNAFPAGYIFNNSEPVDGDIAEFWMADGNTVSFQESVNGFQRIMFYGDSSNPAYKFNIRFVKDL